MQLSKSGIDYIKDKEQLRLKAYQDVAGGTWTIGWGATSYENGAAVRSGDTITEARAEQLFNYHVGAAAGAVSRLVTASINQNQFDALVSLCFNIGAGNFAASTLLKVVNATPNDYDAVGAEFARWVYTTVNGQKVKAGGLVTRRQEESYIYATPTFSKTYSWWVIGAIAALFFFLYRRAA